MAGSLFGSGGTILTRRRTSRKCAGSITANYAAETHAINQDTVSGSGVGYFSFFGGPGAGAGGGRTALGVYFDQGGPTTIGAGNFYVGNATYVGASYPCGGTSTLTAGGLFASNDIVELKAGANYWEEVCGYELDIGAAAGTLFSYKHGMKVNLWETNGAAGRGGADSAYATSSNANTSATAGWDVAYAIGDCYGYWPMKTAGTLIGIVLGPGGGPPVAAAWGIDFHLVPFSAGLIRGPNFTVNSLGGIVQGAIDCSSSTDLTHHIALRAGLAGFNYGAGTLGYVSNQVHNFFAGGGFVGQIGASGLNQMAIGQSSPSPGSFTTLNASGGVHFPVNIFAGRSDVSKHLDMGGGNWGINMVTGAGNMNFVMPGGSAALEFSKAGAFIGYIDQTGINYMAIGAVGASTGNFTALTSAGMTLSGGIHLGAATVTSPFDLSRHLDLYNGQFGMNVQNSGAFNLVTQGSGFQFQIAGTQVAYWNASNFALQVGNFYVTLGCVSLGAKTVTGATDLSKHLDLYNTQLGINIQQNGVMNIVCLGQGVAFISGGTNVGYIGSDGLNNMVVGNSYPSAGTFSTLTVNTSAAVHGPITTSSGIVFSTASSGSADMSKHISMNAAGTSGLNVDGGGTFNHVASGVHNFFAGGSFTGQIAVSGVNSFALGQFGTVQVGSTSGPTWTTGSGVPASVQPVGSLYSRVTTWTAGATLYVSKGGGAWTAVASV
jgi:hypothetical protein